MPKVMVDTCVLIDALAPGRPSHEDACKLFAHALATGEKNLMALASSLKDAYYILCRHYRDEPAARKAIAAISNALELIPCDAGLVKASLGSNEPDFEDGLVRAGAEGASADGIVTRDERGFAGSSCRKLTMGQAAALFSGEL